MKMVKAFFVVIILLQINVFAECKNIVIIESQSFDALHDMDEKWKAIANEKGFTVDIYPQSTLEEIANLNDVDLLIISNGLHEIPQTSLQNVQQFIQNGGHVYLQSEYQIQFPGNQAFSQLVNNLGGSFNWDGEMIGNLTPVNISSDFGTSYDYLPYFWYGAFGSGDNYITPFLSKNDKSFGFYFCSPNVSWGKLMTISDQDWIRLDFQPDFLHQIFDFFFEGAASSIPFVNIETSNDSPCEGEWVTFSTAVECSSPIIQDVQWYVNDVPSPDAKDTTFIANLVEGDQVYYKVTLLLNCAEVEVFSPIIIHSIYQDMSMASVNITLDTTQIYCPDDPLKYYANPTFLATPQNYHYAWYVNQNLVYGVEDSIFLGYELEDDDEVYCELIYDTPCEAELKVASNEIISNVNYWEGISPTIAIQCLNEEVTCEGTPIHFLVEGIGLSDFNNFLWKVDGEVVAEGSAGFCINNPEDGQVVVCEATYNSQCVDGQSVISMPLLLMLDSVVTPEIELQSSATTICTGESVQFEVLENTYGLNTSYQWKVDGELAGGNTPTFELQNPSHLQKVQCIVVVDGGCATQNEIITKEIQVEVIQPVLPVLEISTTRSVICQGETFSATVAGESLPENCLFNWFIDDQMVYSNASPYFFSDSISSTKKVRCEIQITGQTCLVDQIISSNTIEVALSELEMDIIELQPERCGNDGVIEVEAYGGVSPYQFDWEDQSSQAFRDSLPFGKYMVTVTDAIGCVYQDEVSVEKRKDSLFTTIQLQDYSIEENFGILSVETNATNPIYTWHPSVGLSCVDCPQPLVEGGHSLTYEVQVTDEKGCTTTTQVELPFEIHSPTPNIYIPNAFSPNDDDTNDSFTVYGNNPDITIDSMKIFNKVGRLVYEGKNISLSDERSGWDGRDFNHQALPTGVYIYSITIDFKNEVKTYKGDVTLL